MKLHIGGVSLFLALSGLPLGIANALDTGVQNLSISQQESTCKGVVKDSKGETIIGASVVVKGTSNGTITDFDGNFSLSNVKKGATIQISFVGFKSQEIVWDGSSISVALKEDTEVLDEVVVIGYGVQKKADLTGSVANVSAEKLNTHIIRKTKCFDFWERNVLFPKTKRSFFRTPTPLPCPFPLNFSLLIITKKFGNLAKNRYICIV